MSVYVNCFSGVEDVDARKALVSLVQDLLARDFLAGPCAVFSGNFEPGSPMGAGNSYPGPRDGYEPLFASFTLGEFIRSDRAKGLASIDGVEVPLPDEGPVQKRWPVKGDPYQVLCRKRSVGQLREFLQSTPLPEERICIYSRCLNWENPVVRQMLDRIPGGNGDVAFYSLPTPEGVRVNNGKPELKQEPFANFMAMSASYGSISFKNTLLGEIISEHFGPNWKSAYWIEM